MSLEPGTERCGIDLDDGGLGQGICADEFVVGRVESDDDDTALAGYALGAPAEVAGVETKGSEFAVAAADADEMDALVADTGVGRLATFLEGSVEDMLDVVGERISMVYIVPLLAVCGTFGPGG
jgi:hypothetical protein